MKKHANQVAAWGKLLGHCNALGDSYKPSKDSMKGTALEHLLHESENQVEAVHKAEAVLANAISDRQHAFRTLPSVATRVYNALEAQRPTPEYLAAVNRIRKRFSAQTLYTGRDAIPRNEGEPASDKPVRKRTYGDFNSRIDNLQLLIEYLENASHYAPLEEDLSIAGLKQLLSTMQQKHEAVTEASLALQEAKVKCNEMLYGPNGMHELAQLIKKYVHSVYGYSSTQFKTIRKIKFEK
jgi:hypothetical protein